MHSTIDDVYTEYVERCGEYRPARSEEEIRRAVQASVGQHGLVDEMWWTGLSESWLKGVPGSLPWSWSDDGKARNAEYERLRNQGERFAHAGGA